MKQIKKKLPSALATVLGAGVALSVVATAAHAQQAQRVEKIEVTGSNIKRVDSEAVAPVEVITREMIERSGMPTVAEVLRNIPSNTGGSFSESFTNSFAPGASGISLRGLGQKTTLVLINGRRTAGYGFAQNLQDSFVDLNSIPTAAVERIEVLKDGASAVYGSDAIAGVVNIILRKDYKGAEVSLVGGQSEGKNDYHLTATGGFGDLAKDRYSVFGTFDYYKRELTMLSDTDFGRSRDFRGETNGGRNSQSLTGGGTWRQVTAAAANTNNFRAISECRGFVINGQQAVNLGLIGAALGNTAFNIPGNTFCAQDFNNEFTALPEAERLGFMGRATREFSSNFTGYLDVGYSSNKNFQKFQDPFFAGTTALQPTAGGLRPFAYNVTFNPGVAGNPFPTVARYSGVQGDLGTRNVDLKSDTYRLLAGANYTLRTWDFDSAVGWSRNEIEQVNQNAITLSGTSALFGVGTGSQPPIPISSSSPYNLDRPSTNTDAVRNSFRVNYPRQAESELKFVDTKASTELWQMAGGAAGLALGGEFRDEKLNDRPDPRATAGDILGAGITATDGKRTSSAIYGELALPITRIIEAQLAARYDHYSDYGNSTTPKIGVKIKPTNALLLRANWGKGFRAPTLPEISPSVATFFTGVNDPVTGRAVNISGVFAGNPNLEAEKSTSYTAGFIFEPTQNFSIGVSYYNIDWKNIIASPSFQSIVNDGDPTRVIRDPATGDIVTVLSNYRNLNSTKTNGVDLEARYRISSDMGKWTARANFSYVDSFEEEGTEYAGTNGGTNTIPRVRGNVALDWDYRSFANTVQMNYTRGYYQQLLAASWFTPQDPNFQSGTYPERIGSHITYDWFGRYTFSKNISISASVINFTDKKPPYDPGFSSTFLYDFSMYDVRGRQFRLGFTYKM